LFEILFLLEINHIFL